MGKIAKYEKTCVIILCAVFLAAMTFMDANTDAIVLDGGKPALSNPSPANGSTNVALNPTISIYVEDPDGDDMDITINVTNADGGYQVVNYYDVGNGTYTYNLGNINTYGKTYYWIVSVFDGYYYVTATYHFTTLGLVVNMNTSEEYHRIQDAINASSDGNILVVHDGIYRENVVVNKSVILINGSKPVIDGMGSIAFNVTANNASIVGFNITNATYGVYCYNASGFYIANNTFWYDGYGLYWRIEKENLAENYKVYKSTAEENEFYMNSNNDALYAYIDLDYNYGAYNVTVYNISFLDNIFYMNGTRADGIDMDGGIYVEEMRGGNISIGTVVISNNRFYGGDTALDFYGNFIDFTDVNLTVGDVVINGNTILNHSGGSIYVDYYDAYNDDGWYGNTTGIYGDLIICDNYIYSPFHPSYTPTGIEIYDYGYFYYFYDNASLRTGIVKIEENNVTAEGVALYFDYDYVPYDFEDNSSLALGNVFIEDNTLNSTNSRGIYIEYYEEDVGCDMYNNASVHLPNFTIIGNIIHSSGDGIHVYSYENPYGMYGNSSIWFGDFDIDDNTIYSGGYGIYFYYDDLCYENRDDSTTKMGNISITDNEIHSTGWAGITVYYEDIYDLEDKSNLTLGNVDIYGNKVSCNYGIIVQYYITSYEFSTIKMGYVNITENELRNCTDYGMYLYYSAYAADSSTISIERSLIRDNVIDNCSTGIYIYAHLSNDTAASATLEGAIVDYNTISNCSVRDSGIHIEYLNGNKITNNTLYNCSYGIALLHSVSNYIYNNTISGVIAEEACGIYLDYVNDSTFVNNSIFNYRMVTGTAIGIYLGYSSNNTFDGAFIHKLDFAVQVDYGILMKESDDNTFDNVEVCDLHGEFGYGIYIQNSDNNTFNDSYIHDINSTEGYAFYSSEGSNNNTIHNMTIASYPTTISFTYSNGITIKSVDDPHPSDMIPIRKYVKIFNLTAASWMNITFHYTNDEVYGVTEDTIALYHWNESTSSWEEVNASVDTIWNKINANLTSFSEYGVFATEMNISIHLFNPWNLITIPINISLNAESLAGMIDGCMVITKWDAEKQQYIDHIVGINTPGNPNFDIEDGIAYFVGIKYSTWLNMTGQSIENITITLRPGLNAIGWTGIANTTAEDFGGDITNCTYVTKWNETEQEFKTYMINAPNHGFVMETGRGVFVHIKGSEDVMWYGGR